MSTDGGIKIGDYLLSEIIRRVRRTADLSQRELAKHAGVSNALVGSIEAGSATPSLSVLQRLLNTAGYRLVVVDVDGHLVLPLQIWQDVGDLAGRRFPAHLDTILDPVFGEWWADIYGLTAPPETFRRSREHRDWVRKVSRWEVRVAQLRNQPIPDPPRGLGVYSRERLLAARLAAQEKVAGTSDNVAYGLDEYGDDAQ
ncbi:multiprotein-bridging factor 1 family protein [uncultured Jatrophihabitans sp.]|uniref:helix-turn-helix domain-containing protein n=1 Tax=uncultured Jatrophihabitans sp. TaxID=1610747 RepID=UPI0035C96782